MSICQQYGAYSQHDHARGATSLGRALYFSPAPTRLAQCFTELRAWSKHFRPGRRRAPSWHCRDARVYGHTTTAMHNMSAPPPSPLLLLGVLKHPFARGHQNDQMEYWALATLHMQRRMSSDAPWQVPTYPPFGGRESATLSLQ